MFYAFCLMREMEKLRNRYIGEEGGAKGRVRGREREREREREGERNGERERVIAA